MLVSQCELMQGLQGVYNRIYNMVCSPTPKWVFELWLPGANCSAWKGCTFSKINFENFISEGGV